jgi:hypothetical protein
LIRPQSQLRRVLETIAHSGKFWEISGNSRKSLFDYERAVEEKAMPLYLFLRAARISAPARSARRQFANLRRKSRKVFREIAILLPRRAARKSCSARSA